jgi:hypothetical protein
MVAAMLLERDPEAPERPEAPHERDAPERLRRGQAQLDDPPGAFDRALRAAASAWTPRVVAGTERTVSAWRAAIPEILAAWRAAERELAGMTGDSPAQELLEANVSMLQALYQRLYRERIER